MSSLAPEWWEEFFGWEIIREMMDIQAKSREVMHLEIRYVTYHTLFGKLYALVVETIGNISNFFKPSQ